MNLKLEAWYLLHNKRKFWSDAQRFLHILRPEKSEYWEDCIKYYSSLDVKGKVVLDIGSDFGTSPMFFIKKGAKTVYGFSLDKQYFKDERYTHHGCDSEYDLCMKVKLFYPLILYQEKDSPIILKMDCEGCEWNFSPEFLESFADWVIALHSPVKNEKLYEYITRNGRFIGRENDEEFATYKKKEVLE